MSDRSICVIAWGAVFLLALGAGAALGESPAEKTSGWQLTRDEEGIRSYKRIRPDSPLVAFKAEGVIDAPVPRVLSVVLDAERVGEWITALEESIVLRWIEEPVEYIQYTRFDAPWPVSDRFFLSRVTLAVDPETYETEIRYYDTPEGADHEKGIRGYAGGSYYLLRPIDGGRRTLFMGVSVADPKGAIPAWLVNWMGASWPHKTFLALRRQVSREDVDDLPMIEPLFAGFEDQACSACGVLEGYGSAASLGPEKGGESSLRSADLTDGEGG